MRPEAAPIKCAGRESAGLPALSHTKHTKYFVCPVWESAGKPADSLPAHFIGVASVLTVYL